MLRRNTIQRSLVYEAVNALQNHATADEIFALIAKDHPHISKGTVYRNLNQLVEDGEIRAIINAAFTELLAGNIDGETFVSQIQSQLG